MEFKKYQHLERFGTTEVQNIELGECFIFPKIDGTNASVWLDADGQVCAGSRNRQLSLDKDNAGFLDWVCKQGNIIKYLLVNPTHRLYGEWLVPHSLKTYREDAWRKFYIFDVAIDTEEGVSYLNYRDYQPLMEEFDLDYIPPIIILNNSNYDRIVLQLERNNFLIEDGKGKGEGIVLKNYSYVNKYNRTVWAKIVTSEFKERHTKKMGAPEVNFQKMVEQDIADKYVTKALCDKVYAKIENDGGFTSREIPRLLNTVYYDLITEESWNFIKEFKNPTVNFKTLQHFVINKIKENLPNIF